MGVLACHRSRLTRNRDEGSAQCPPGQKRTLSEFDGDLEAIDGNIAKATKTTCAHVTGNEVATLETHTGLETEIYSRHKLGKMRRSDLERAYLSL